MSFDTDPAEERTQIEECIREIKRLQARLVVLEAVVKAAEVVDTNAICDCCPGKQCNLCNLKEAIEAVREYDSTILG